MALQNVFVANGFMGGQVIADTATHTPTAPRTQWKGILIVADAVIASLTGNIRGDTTFGGTTLKQGFMIPGTFSSIKLTSGSVLALDDAT